MLRQVAHKPFHQFIHLCIRQPEHSLHGLQHSGGNHQHGFAICKVSNFIDHQVEQFANRPLILIVTLGYSEEPIPDEHDGNVSGQGIIGKTMVSLGEQQRALACLEKYLYVPTLAVDADDVLFA